MLQSVTASGSTPEADVGDQNTGSGGDDVRLSEDAAGAAGDIKDGNGISSIHLTKDLGEAQTPAAAPVASQL